MRVVEIRRRTAGPAIEWNRNRRALSGCRVFAEFVDRFRPGIVRLKAEASGKLPLDRELQRMIARITAGVRNENAPEILVRPPLLDIACGGAGSIAGVVRIVVVGYLLTWIFALSPRKARWSSPVGIRPNAFSVH